MSSALSPSSSGTTSTRKATTSCPSPAMMPGAVDERPGPYRLLNDCQGGFFRHHTWHKERPREEFQDSAMQLLTRLLQERVKQNVDTILIEESKGQLGRR
ncbi:unnamed protein product [Zymoseptoria tritici ST99CH_1E4]|uniref:Uncharacterized protein n=1 Tax=Zymoseptoria tritici ST99CH_1E4 TaxID=1276532 RepID=A0A2H1G5M4_ZYMTR|nr:unnamed protein product [Zymoseptoria tritici ST99CH_1E4]